MSLLDDLFATGTDLDFPVKAPGPTGRVQYTEQDLLERPSGDLFGISQNAGMIGSGERATDPNVVVLSTMGGWPEVALGAHTGHNELYKLIESACAELTDQGLLPFALHTSDTCDGRTQGTRWATISLASRNVIYKALSTQLRGVPNAEAVIGIATCDKGLPAMTMLMASLTKYPTGNHPVGKMPGAIIPGGVTLPPEEGEDAGSVQTLGVRFAKGLVNLEQAQDLGCRACATPGGGCQFFGTAATAQAVAEAMGLTLPLAALAPSGFPVWTNIARRTAATVAQMRTEKRGVADVLTQDSIENAMLVMAAMGGSTNLLLHIPAFAHCAGLDRPTRADFERINRLTPRLVDCLPTGIHPTVNVYMAGGVPEVLALLMQEGTLKSDAQTILGLPLGELTERWVKSERRKLLREKLYTEASVDADDVILPPAKAKALGFSSSVTFPTGNIAPEGSVVKSTSISRKLLDSNGGYHRIAPCRTFTSESAAITAIKTGVVKQGEVVVIMCRGPLGAGMPETFEVTAALKGIPELANCALLTDARFSGVTSGPCFGHVSPEALVPDSPFGKLQDGDMIEIHLDTVNLIGSINLVGERGEVLGLEAGNLILASRSKRPDLVADPYLPDYIKQWALVQSLSGGPWGGCIEDYQTLENALSHAR